MTATRLTLGLIVSFGTACGDNDTEPDSGRQETAANPGNEVPTPNSLERCKTSEFVVPAGALEERSVGPRPGGGV